MTLQLSIGHLRNRPTRPELLRTARYGGNRWTWVYKEFRPLATTLLACTLPLMNFQPALAGDDRSAQIEFFEARIRPALIEYCYECHNAQRHEGGLALDSRGGVQAGGDRQRELGLSLEQRNLILEAMRHDHDDLKMPEGGAQLKPSVIADFENWFAKGAVDPRDRPPAPGELEPENLRKLVFEQRERWWALQPLSRNAIPRTLGAQADASAEFNQPIDRFTLAAMREHDLHPSPPANRRDLLRRLHFAIVGLPPDPQVLADFEQSSDGASIDRIIDQLLDSPQFGERWARHWMDWIRYAESHGSEGDPAIPYATEYRDYLIRALNADVPYDRLVEEHIAGDLLADPRVNQELGINESAIGPAHLRMVFHGFAPTDAMEEKVRFVDDQVAAISKSFLGLTVACARCHDHKFDAIRQRDYYALFGILGSCHPGIIDANTRERQQAHQPELRQLKTQIRDSIADVWLDSVDRVIQDLFEPDVELAKAMRAASDPSQTLYLWHQLAAAQDGDSELSKSFVDVMQKYLQRAEQIDSEAVLALDDASAHQANRQISLSEMQWFVDGNGTASTPAESGAFTVDVTGDRYVKNIFPAGRFSHLLSTRHRNVLLSPRVPLEQELELWMLVAGEGDASLRYVVQDYPRDGTVYPVTNLNSPQWHWQKYALDYWKGDSIHLELATAGDAPVLARGTQRSWFGLRSARFVSKGRPAPAARDWEQFTILARAYATARPTSREQWNACVTDALRDAIVAWRDGSASDEQALWLNAWNKAGLLSKSLHRTPNVLAATALPKSLETGIKRYRFAEAAVPLPRRVPGVWETVAREQRLFIRGDHREPAEVVKRGFVSALDDRAYQSPMSGRHELALSIIGPAQHVAARVIVNRLWHHLFGRGLVATPDNFGKLGSAPTHPELLDYLAQDLIDHQWSLKYMIGQIVRSQTWQQSSHVDMATRSLDPENLWLARASLRRLEAEAIRDTQLLVAGRLDRTMYGGAVDGTTPRRSIYVRVLRNSLDPQLHAFDFPEPTSTIGRRDVTNVPAQSLMLLNNPQIRSLARDWAQATLERKAGQGNDALIDDLFQRGLGRPASEGELAEVSTLYASLRQAAQRKDEQRQQLRHDMTSTQSKIDALAAPVQEAFRQQWLAKRGRPSDTDTLSPRPIVQWNFDTPSRAEASDPITSTKAPGGDALWSNALGGDVIGEAEVVDGAFVARGGYFQSKPLPVSLHEKTLEAWVSIDDLEQRGGGVMSIQTTNGETFDAIVFGEMKLGHWLAGSNSFVRTQSFEGQKEEDRDIVHHLAITYSSDGKIAGYRDGKPYGRSYQSSGIQDYAAGQSLVTLGCRHLPSGGNKELHGRWQRARLYDRALTAEEVLASFQNQPHNLNSEEIMAKMNMRDQEVYANHKQAYQQLQNQFLSLGEDDADSVDVRSLTDIALALMSTKEFIFIP